MALVDEASGLYNLAGALDRLSAAIRRESERAGQAVETSYLQGAAGLPKPSDLRLDRYLAKRRRDRKEGIRQDLARFGEL